MITEQTELNKVLSNIVAVFH